MARQKLMNHKYYTQLLSAVITVIFFFFFLLRWNMTKISSDHVFAYSNPSINCQASRMKYYYFSFIMIRAENSVNRRTNVLRRNFNLISSNCVVDLIVQAINFCFSSFKNFLQHLKAKWACNRKQWVSEF